MFANCPFVFPHPRVAGLCRQERAVAPIELGVHLVTFQHEISSLFHYLLEFVDSHLRKILQIVTAPILN